jgi:hypothetical protein
MARLTSYQWRKNAIDIPGAVFSTFGINDAQFSDSGEFDVVIANPGGSALSAPALFRVLAISPTILVQPVGASIIEGDDVMFSVTATGTDPLYYQWQKDLSDIPGATSPSFSIESAQFSDIGSYRVIVTNAGGTATSNAVSLAVASAGVPPTITVQPTSQAFIEGTNYSLSVTATGTAPLTYQWKKNAQNVARATNQSLTITSATAADAGDYTVTITAGGQTITSAAASLRANGSGGSTESPRLDVALSATQLVLSWPVTTTGFSLQSATSLTPPINWTPVTPPITPSGERNTVSVSLGSSPRFYRLAKP